jgi:hypothetical protein
MLAKREVVTALGGYNQAVAEDYELWIRAWNSGFKLGRTRGYGILYRIHPGQLSQQVDHSKKVASDPALVGVHKELLNRLETQGLIGAGENLQERVRRALANTGLIYRLLGSSPVRKILASSRSLIRNK